MRLSRGFAINSYQHTGRRVLGVETGQKIYVLLMAKSQSITFKIKGRWQSERVPSGGVGHTFLGRFQCSQLRGERPGI
jgi:hypothetical protein